MIKNRQECHCLEALKGGKHHAHCSSYQESGQKCICLEDNKMTQALCLVHQNLDKSRRDLDTHQDKEERTK